MPYPMNTSVVTQGLDLPSACNAKTRSGHPCKNAPRLPSFRCCKHGGKTPIKHGKRTKHALAIRKHAKALRVEMNLIQKTLAVSVNK